MKTLQMILALGAVALLGIFNVVSAEMRNEFSQQALTFTIDAGDGAVVMPDVSFDAIGSESGENAQTTCAMTPGGNMQSELLEQPPLAAPQYAQWTNSVSPDITFQPISSLDTPPNYDQGRRYPMDPPITEITAIVPDDEPEDDDSSTSIVPEPATMILIGLGLGGAAFASRRRRKVR